MDDHQLQRLLKLPDWEKPPRRVVSLVPSMTESLFELGFGESVVAATDYCSRPFAQLVSMPRVGGPKTPSVPLIINAEPDLVIANQEENSQETIEALLDQGIAVWMVFPKTVEESIDVLRSLLALFHTDKPALKINTLQMAVDYAAAAAEFEPKVRYFCPIWLGEERGLPWFMTFNADTYMSDLLRLFGGENVFSQRRRRNPLAADLGLSEPVGLSAGEDLRYPRVTIGEIISAAPELILVPDEPYKFSESDKGNIFQMLAETPAVRKKNVRFVEGSLITWDGVRLGAALQKLPEYFH